MAEEIEFERVYNIPLRKEFSKAPNHERASKSVRAVRLFLKKHVKSDNVKIGKYLNHKILEHGRKNPPHHVSVKVIKYKDNLVKAELVGAPEEKPVDLKEVKAPEKPVEINLDKKETKKEKEEEIKKEVLESPQVKKGKEVKDLKELSDEKEEEIRKKDIIKRRDKKEMIEK